MSSGQTPTFIPLAENLWVHDGPLTILGIAIGHRMTVVRLENGRLWVHSPSKWTPELGAALDELGEVETFVAPNLFHDLFWPDFFEKYPHARFLAPPGMRKQHPDWKFEELLTANSSFWQNDFELIEIGGMPKISETVFRHRPSRSLIVADLVFNFPEGSIRGWTKLAMKLNAAYGRVTPSRYFKSMIGDPKALRDSVDRVLKCGFERIVVGHGEVVEGDARDRLASAYHFLTA